MKKLKFLAVLAMLIFAVAACGPGHYNESDPGRKEIPGKTGFYNGPYGVVTKDYNLEDAKARAYAKYSVGDYVHMSGYPYRLRVEKVLLISSSGYSRFTTLRQVLYVVSDGEDKLLPNTVPEWDLTPVQ